MKRSIGLIAAFALAGPLIGMVLFVLWLIIEAAFRGVLSYALIADTTGGIFTLAPFAYIFAGVPAVLAGAGSAIVAALTSSRRLRYAGAFVIGFAVSVAYLALRPNTWNHSGAWPTSGTYLFGAIGALAALGSLAIYHYFAWLDAERRK